MSTDLIALDLDLAEQEPKALAAKSEHEALMKRAFILHDIWLSRFAEELD